MQYLPTVFAHYTSYRYCPYAVMCSVLQGKEIIEYYLKELEDEGVTHIPRWSPPQAPPPTARLQLPLTSAPANAILVPTAEETLSASPTDLPPGSPDGQCSESESTQ